MAEQGDAPVPQAEVAELGSLYSIEFVGFLLHIGLLAAAKRLPEYPQHTLLQQPNVVHYVEGFDSVFHKLYNQSLQRIRFFSACVR
jgi:hypothetical protein